LKSTNKNYWMPVPEQHYNKHYLMRKIQEEEAEQEINEYSNERTYPLPTSEVPNSQELDAEG
jgi:hypothetical protein